jgi:hypothetical protein
LRVVTEPAKPTFESVVGTTIGGMTDDPRKAGIPVHLQVQNRQPLSAEKWAKVEEAAARAAARVVADSAPRAEMAKARENTRKEKARVRIEKLEAKKSGEAAKMPLVGKDAARFIAGAPKAKAGDVP